MGGTDVFTSRSAAYTEVPAAGVAAGCPLHSALEVTKRGEEGKKLNRPSDDSRQSNKPQGALGKSAGTRRRRAST